MKPLWALRLSLPRLKCETCRFLHISHSFFSFTDAQRIYAEPWQTLSESFFRYAASIKTIQIQISATQTWMHTSKNHSFLQFFKVFLMKKELSWSHALFSAMDLINIAHLCKNTCTNYDEEWDQQATATLSVPVLIVSLVRSFCQISLASNPVAEEISVSITRWAPFPVDLSFSFGAKECAQWSSTNQQNRHVPEELQEV